MKENPSVTSEMEDNNPFTVAGENVPDPENFDGIENVVPIKARPHDRLPTKGVFKLPPKQGLYHTKRAEAARQRAASVLPSEHVASAHEALGGLLGRWNLNYADSSDHNVMGLAYALWYAKMGWPVVDAYGIDDSGIPAGKMQQDGKVPLGAGWQNRATTSHDAIIAAWAGDGQYPPNDKGEVFNFKKPKFPRNVSVVIPQGYWVLDVDDKAALARLEVELGPLPGTVRSVSGSGGEHIVFKTDLDIRNTASIVSKKIDVRGFGGQIIVEPSLHKTGGFYRWADGCAPWECDVVPAPEAWEQAAYNATKSRQAETKRKASTKTNDKAGQDSKPPKSCVSDGRGFEDILTTIGDHEGGGGFDSPIYRAACSWFASHGPDVDSSELFATLRTCIAEAERCLERNRTKYDTDDYLERRIEQAREFIADQDVDEEADDKGQDFEARASAFEYDKTSEADVEAFVGKAHAAGVEDKGVRNRISKNLSNSTALSLPDIKKMWTDLDKEQTRGEREKKKKERNSICTDEDEPKQTSYAKECVKATNTRDPYLFHYMEEAAIVRNGRLKVLNFDGRKHELGKVTVFERPKGEKDFQHVFPPQSVVSDLFAQDLSEFLLPLRGVVDTPFFAADGTLVTENGYHAGSEVYLDSDLVLDRVSGAPPAKEAKNAAEFIIEEVLADFPLGGLTRQEIMEKAFSDEGVPAVANALAMILMPFARNMIHGPTPGHIVNKPAPGTGAGFLVDVCTTIASGAPAPALAMPKDKAELSKTLSSALLDGESAIFFDNINHEMDSADLASAMTAPETGFMFRILGKTQTVIVHIRNTWIFAANTLTMSSELLRRCILIDLDRKDAEPESWTPADGWRHPDVRAWTRENRSGLVHACLTIIQHWVAGGMNKSDETLASFENWAGVMGGILNSCGVSGFMGNQSDLKGLSDGNDDELTSVVQAIAEVMYGVNHARLYVGSKSDAEGKKGKFGLFDILHNMPNTPMLDNWGYREVVIGDDVDVQYHNTRKAGARFKAAAKRTYLVRLDGKDFDARFECETDTSANVNCYKLTLTPR